MAVTNYYLLWSISIPSSWISALLGFLIAWIIVRVKFGKEAADSAADLLFVVLLVWKLSVVITDLDVILKSPASLLYFNGGTMGFVGGLIVAFAVFIFSKSRGQTFLYKPYLTMIVFSQVGYQIGMVVLNDGMIAVKMATVILFSLLAILFYRVVKMDSFSLLSLALLFVSAHAFVAALQPEGFQGIPFVATGVASLLVIFMERLKIPPKKMEGLHE